MKRIKNTRYILMVLTVSPIILGSWGFYAHKLINQAAVFSLPPEVAVFYKKHIDFISEHAIDPDKRCYVDTLESPRHYIDLDILEEKNSDSMPIHWSQAKEKFTERKLLAAGIIPWQIERSFRNLRDAFAQKDLKTILRHAADLGHYVSDAHVPLHTTQNYNGQFTNQVGIHAFWETRLPEKFAGQYDLWVGKASYIPSVIDESWKIIRESHSLIDSVLLIEKELSSRFNPDQKYAFVIRNNRIQRNYSDSYSTAYHKMLNGMVERRLRSSILKTASLWYTAWVDAGQPDLSQIMDGFSMVSDSSASPGQHQKIIGRTEWH